MRTRPALLLLPLLGLLVRRAGAGFQVQAVHPLGGPVGGDTSVTVTGYGLAGVECEFVKEGAPGTVPEPKRSMCKFDAKAPDLGRSCVCSAPKAPRFEQTTEVTDNLGVVTKVVTPIGDFLPGPVIVTAVTSEAEQDWSPFVARFTYIEYNKEVYVDSIEPWGGHPELYTLVTVTGSGFVDWGAGVFCSFPGPDFDPFLPTFDPEYDHKEFVSPATLVSEKQLLCTIPPLANNSDPVFVEVCVTGHPDHASVFGRMRRDDFCTASLTRFDYADTPYTNLTLWNSSVVAGPVDGGTIVDVFGRYGFIDALSLSPETIGLLDFGRPACVWGRNLGSSMARAGRIEDWATSPAKPIGAQPLLFYRDAAGVNETMRANVGRRAMCKALGDGQHYSDERAYCSCHGTEPNGINAGKVPPCGCGCRGLLRLTQSESITEYDFCIDRGPPMMPDISCGPPPRPDLWHRRIPAQPAPYARCVAPRVPGKPGWYQLEYSPFGDHRSTSNSIEQLTNYLYYDAAYDPATPTGMPLTGGTVFEVTGDNFSPFNSISLQGAANIYGIVSQV